MRPTINICDNVPHVGDWRRWRQLSKQVLPWRSKKLADPFDPNQSFTSRLSEARGLEYIPATKIFLATSGPLATSIQHIDERCASIPWLGTR
jgi:hypothetical protein